MGTIVLVVIAIVVIFCLGSKSERNRQQKEEDAREERIRLRQQKNAENSVKYFEECRRKALENPVAEESHQITSRHNDEPQSEDPDETDDETSFDTVMNYIEKSKCLENGNRYEVYIKPSHEKPGSPAYEKSYNSAVGFAKSFCEAEWEHSKKHISWWIRNAESGDIAAAGGISASGKPFQFYREDKIAEFYAEKVFEKVNIKANSCIVESDIKMSDNKTETLSLEEGVKIKDIKIGGDSVGGVFIGDGIDRSNYEVEDALRRRFNEPDYAISVFSKYAANEFGVAYKHEICKILRNCKRYEEELPVIDQILQRIRTISYGEASDYVVEYIMSKEEDFVRRQNYVTRLVKNKNKRK